jgi:phosphoglycolate phosphatase-like HAD superfamily hydrolase
VILASSAREDEADHYLDLLEARDLVDGWTTSADVERTKPHPDLVRAALEKAQGGGPTVLVGDSTWDIEAAKAARIPTLAVLTGGFPEEDLSEAGAAGVIESVADLRADRRALRALAA